MIQALPKTVTFDEFIAWYPENSEHRYELHDGIIVEMPKPTGMHSEVAGFISGELFLEIKRTQKPYFIELLGKRKTQSMRDLRYKRLVRF
jgi:Uma2 family endonuclease